MSPDQIVGAALGMMSLALVTESAIHERKRLQQDRLEAIARATGLVTPEGKVNR